MRNTEERVLAVKQKAQEIERQKQKRHSRNVMVLSTAACLLFIVGLSFAMPGITAGMPESEYAYFGVAASIFDGSGGFGYVIIGLLAFILGVSVTILAYSVCLRSPRDHGDGEDSDG